MPLVGRLVLPLALGITLASCGESPAKKLQSGVLLVAQPSEGVFEYEIASGKSVMIVPSPPNGFVLDPAVSPEGKKLAYVLQFPSAKANALGPTYEVWAADRDGSGAVRLIAADSGESIRQPQWVDESNVAFIRTETIAPRGTNIVLHKLVKSNIETGQSTELRENVLAFDLIPGEGHMAFTELSRTHAGQGLILAKSDAAGGRDILARRPHFFAIGSPRLSPRSDSIAFAAAAPSLSVSSSVALSAGSERAPLAHGAPSDVWLIGASEAAPRTLAALQEDDPSIAWSGDGTRIYALGIDGLYEIAVDSGAVTRLGDGAVHGQLFWASRPAETD